MIFRSHKTFCPWVHFSADIHIDTSAPSRCGAILLHAWGVGPRGSKIGPEHRLPATVSGMQNEGMETPDQSNRIQDYYLANLFEFIRIFFGFRF